MEAVQRLGCIVCRNEGRGYVPCHVHHLLQGGRRIGHLSTIGLCPTHHNDGVRNAQATSRHPWKRDFEKRYGTEHELLKATMKMIDNGEGTSMTAPVSA